MKAIDIEILMAMRIQERTIHFLEQCWGHDFSWEEVSALLDELVDMGKAVKSPDMSDIEREKAYDLVCRCLNNQFNSFMENYHE